MSVSIEDWLEVKKREIALKVKPIFDKIEGCEGEIRIHVADNLIQYFTKEDCNTLSMVFKRDIEYCLSYGRDDYPNEHYLIVKTSAKKRIQELEDELKKLKTSYV